MIEVHASRRRKAADLPHVDYSGRRHAPPVLHALIDYLRGHGRSRRRAESKRRRRPHDLLIRDPVRLVGVGTVARAQVLAIRLEFPSYHLASQ
jgi:hypothetical protein